MCLGVVGVCWEGLRHDILLIFRAGVVSAIGVDIILKSLTCTSHIWTSAC